MNIDTKKIKIQVVFFASISDFIGESKLDLEVEDGSTIKTIQDLIFKEKKWTKPILYAINHSYVSVDSRLKENDEIAFMSFVSGG